MKKRIKPSFSPEFRNKAALLVVEKGYNPYEAAESMGLGSPRWTSGLSSYAQRPQAKQ